MVAAPRTWLTRMSEPTDSPSIVPVVVVSCAAARDLTTSALTERYRTLSRMGREACQGESGVVVDGTYYGITEYAEV